MEKEFVTHEIALALKELGFDEPCLAYFEDDEYYDLIHVCENQKEGNFIIESFQYGVKAPLWQQVIDWFREFKNIVMEVWYDNTQNDGFPWLYEIYINNKEHEHNGSYYNSFYEAREQAILKAIELIKNKTKRTHTDS